MFLVAAAMVSAWLITVADLPSKIIRHTQALRPGNQTLLLVAIMVLVMIVGTAMDMTPTILILRPCSCRGEGRWHRPPSTLACCSSSTTPSAHHPARGHGAQRGGRVGRIPCRM